MNSMNGSCSFSGCWGRRLAASRVRGSRVRGSRVPGSLVCGSRVFASRAGAFGDGDFTDAAFDGVADDLDARRFAGGGAFGVGIGADASLLAGAPRFLDAVRVA